MMFILYDIVFLFFSIIYLPYCLLRKKLHRGIVQRLGFLPDNLNLNRPIWIHAVSVGEAKIAGVLINQLRIMYPKKRFAISTVTPTGNSIAHNLKSAGDFVFYLPFDLSFITSKVIRKLQPSICIIVETEIWPNLITQLNKMQVPIVLVNARISDSSFFGYTMIKPLIKPILNKINLFCVQSNRDAQRLSGLGVAPEKLKTTGNMKYDILNLTDFKINYQNYRLRLGLSESEQLFIAGSTHLGEEEIILEVYRGLISEFPGLRLLIAPRHPGRASQIESLVNKFGFTPILISKLNLSVNHYDRRESRGSGVLVSDTRDPLSAIFILDTIGQLIPFYAIADIVFVGGSLIKKGGQNILEPAFFQKPIIFGPHMFNFRDISRLYLLRKAARMAQGKDELLREVRFLLNSPAELQAMGRRAKQLISENQGATSRNVQRLSIFISH
jgi:3-deoxy-D-manno-octulosonic-acid transferase